MTSQLDRLTVADILKWADQHHDWTGRWPISRSGQVMGMNGLTWEAVNTALRKGGRGLPGGTTLSQLLKKRRGIVDSRRARPDLTTKQIIEWAQSHNMLTSRWPERDSGPVREAPDITWATIDSNLRRGGPNLPGGSSLITLLRESLGVWSSRGSRRLTVALILKWADEHHARTGRWPVVMEGQVNRHTKETWVAINEALRHGRRGLPGGSTLAQLLAEHRGANYDPMMTPLSVKQILAWADEHHRLHRRWPTAKSGRAPQAKMSWAIIDRRLRVGGQGLPGGSSLSAILAERKAAANA